MTWNTFTNWLTADTEALLHLLEVSTEFPKMETNDLFNKQIDRLRHQTDQPEMRRQLEKAKGFDWVGYIAKSLRNADMPHHEIEPMTSDLVTRLLVRPGTLFQGLYDQPILARFKVSVRNAIINLAEKRQRRRRWFPHVTPEDVEIAMHSAPGDDETVERFRKLVQDELGDQGVKIFDARMDGLETKSLVSMPELASPSAYQVKKTVQQIKALAQQFGDEQFQAMVQRAMDAEQEILARRFPARATA
jgi:hypothetical protein